MGKHVLVIGAGIVGASVALHLAKAGCAVTIVDAGSGGGLATRDSFAWINASWGNPESYFHFRRRSMAGWRRLQEAVPDLAVNWCGGLLWDLPPDKLADFADEHGRWGYGIQLVGRDEALAIEPGLKAPPQLAVHVEEEGTVEPVPAANALLAAALASGAKLVTDTPVASLLISDGGVTGVEIETGSALEADETVIAAGADSARLLRSAGVSLRLDAPAGLIAHSTRCDSQLLRGLVLTPDFHVRQTAEGRLIAGADFAGADPEGNGEEMAKALLESVKAMVGGSEGLSLDFISVGRRPTPADGFPAIGRPRGVEGLYVTVLHSGVTLAPIVGELASREIATGQRDLDLAPYDPNRAALVEPT